VPLGGLHPDLYHGTVDSILASADLGRTAALRALRTILVRADPSGIVWRPLVAPQSRYPWSVLWRAGDSSEHVSALVDSGRTLSQQLGWLQPAAG